MNRVASFFVLVLCLLPFVHSDSANVGSNFVVWADIKDTSNYYSVDNATLTILYPNTSVYVSDVNMTYVSTGLYKYDFIPYQPGSWYTSASFYKNGTLYGPVSDVIVVQPSNSQQMDIVTPSESAIVFGKNQPISILLCEYCSANLYLDNTLLVGNTTLRTNYVNWTDFNNSNYNLKLEKLINGQSYGFVRTIPITVNNQPLSATIEIINTTIQGNNLSNFSTDINSLIYFSVTNIVNSNSVSYSANFLVKDSGNSVVYNSTQTNLVSSSVNSSTFLLNTYGDYNYTITFTDSYTVASTYTGTISVLNVNPIILGMQPYRDNEVRNCVANVECRLKVSFREDYCIQTPIQSLTMIGTYNTSVLNPFSYSSINCDMLTDVFTPSTSGVLPISLNFTDVQGQNVYFNTTMTVDPTPTTTIQEVLLMDLIVPTERIDLLPNTKNSYTIVVDNKMDASLFSLEISPKNRNYTMYFNNINKNTISDFAPYKTNKSITLYVDTSNFLVDEEVVEKVTLKYGDLEVSKDITFYTRKPEVSSVSFMQRELFSFTLSGFSSIDTLDSVSKKISVTYGFMLVLISIIFFVLFVGNTFKSKDKNVITD